MVKEKIFNDIYADGLTELVVYYAGREGIEEMILKFQSVRSVVEGLYQVLTNRKQILPIETLGESEKRRIWKLTEGCEERKKAAKAIYLMELIKN